MRTKEYLGLLFQRCYWNLKSLKLLFWIPVIVVNLVLPALNYVCYRQNGVGAYMQVDIVEKALLLLPFLSVWWVIFVLREYVEADGSEVLYVCRSRIKLVDALCPFLLYLFNITLLYSVYIAIFPDVMPLEYARMLCICAFFFGLTYFLVYFTKSITITLLVNLVYYIVSELVPMRQPVFPVYKVNGDVTPELFYKLYLPLLAAGVLLGTAGVLINRRTACKN